VQRKLPGDCPAIASVQRKLPRIAAVQRKLPGDPSTRLIQTKRYGSCHIKYVFQQAVSIVQREPQRAAYKLV